MKRPRITYILAVLAAMLVGIFAAACGAPEPEGEYAEPAGDEVGVYYYEHGAGEYLLTLNDDKTVTLEMGEFSGSGVYALKDGDLTIDLGALGNIAAKLENNAISFTFNNVSLKFLKNIKFSVRFDTNGGSSVSSITVTNGKKAERPAIDPHKAKNTFTGWYTDKETKNLYNFDTPVTGNLTLYAGWRDESAIKDVEFKVAFDLNYENAAAPTTAETVDGKVALPADPVREGYSFEGWWISSDNDPSKPMAKLTADTKISENMTVYAMWVKEQDPGITKLPKPLVEVNEKTISWNAVTGARSYRVTITDPDGVETPKAVLGTTLAFDFAAAEPGEYKISVVALASSGESNNSDPAERIYRNKALSRVSVFEVQEPSLLKFNKVANATGYVIEIDCGDKGHDHSELSLGAATSYNFESCIMQEGGIKFKVTAVAEGYMSSTSEEFAFSRDLAEVTGLAYDPATETLGWDAVENANDYVVCVGDEETVVKGTSFDLKYIAGSAAGINVTVKARAKGYNSKDASSFVCNKTGLATPSGLTVADFILSWGEVDGASTYTVKIAGKEFNAISRTELDLETAGIQWDPATDYSISVKAVGANGESLWSDALDAKYLALHGTLEYESGEVSWRHVIGVDGYEVRINEGEAVSVEAGKNSAPVKLEKAGDNKIQVRYKVGDERSEWATKTVTAYSVTFDSTDCEAGEETVQYYATGDKVALPQDYIKPGYILDGWYDIAGAAGANGARYIDETFTAGKNITLYANWDPAEFIITLNWNEKGTGPIEPIKVKYGAEFTLPLPTEIKDGTKGFGGWCLNKAGNGIMVTDQDGVGIGRWNRAENITLYARWNDLFSYQRIASGYRIKKGSEAVSAVVINIPQTYQGEDDAAPVTISEIGASAFSSCNNLQSVSFHDTVELVDIDAFSGLSALEQINVKPVEGNNDPKYFSQDGILYYTGDETTGVQVVCFPRGRKGEVTLDNRLEYIPYSAFYYSSLDTLVIPASVKHIEREAFRYSKIVELKFEYDGDKTDLQPLEIADNAFMSMSALETISLPKRLQELNVESFRGCSNLAFINVEEGGAYLTVDGMLCQYVGNEVRIIYCPLGRTGDVTISNQITQIGDNAFSGHYVLSSGDQYPGCKNITSVKIPHWVNYIGEHAFSGCSGLLSVTFLGGEAAPAMTIAANAFGVQYNANGVAINVNHCAKNLGSVYFEKGSNVQIIGREAFAGTALVEIELPNTIREIGENAFRNCKLLTSVIFNGEAGDPEITFNDDCFNGCILLENVTLPANVGEFMDGVFNGCSKLANVYVDPNNAALMSINGVLYNKVLDESKPEDDPDRYYPTEIKFYPAGREGNYDDMPSTITSIGAGVFKGKNNITSITISKSVEYIGDEAFADCKGLSEVIFDPDIEGAPELVIGARAFQNCSALASVSLPARIKAIPDRMFSSSGLESITIPSTVTTIGEYAFNSCKKLAGTVTIPNTVISLGASCFNACSALEEVVFEGERTQNIQFFVHDTISSKPSYTFYGCTSLRRVTLPEKLVEIPYATFNGCTKMTSINIPGTVSFIGRNAFYNCSALKNVTFDPRDGAELVFENGSYSSDEHGNTYVGVFALCKGLESITLPEGTARIADYMFLQCTSLKYVYAPASLKNGTYIPPVYSTISPTIISIPAVCNLAIGAGAFYECKSLVEVNIASGGEGDFSIDDRAFYSCVLLETLNLPSRLSDYKTDTDVNGPAIGKLAFGYVNSETSANASYSSSSYATAISLQDINIAEGGQYYKSVDGVVYTADGTEAVLCPKSRRRKVVIPNAVTFIRNRAFFSCVHLTVIEFEEGEPAAPAPAAEGEEGEGEEGEVTVPDYSLIIGEDEFNEKNEVVRGNAFAGTAITSIVLPARLKELNNFAFSQCTKLASVTFNGDKLTKIGRGSFFGCSSLTSITVPDAVTSIGDQAFLNATALSTISLNTENPVLASIGMGAFMKTRVEVVTLPTTLVELGQNVFSNCTKLREVTMPDTIASLDGIFTGCFALETVRIVKGEGDGSLSEVDGVLYSDGGKTLSYYPVGKSDTTFKVPVGVTKIGKEAFAFNPYLETVILPCTVEYVGEYAFRMCRSLKVFRVLDEDDRDTAEPATPAEKFILGATAAGKSNQESSSSKYGPVFLGCYSLEEVYLPSRETEICSYCFLRCESLTKVDFGEDPHIAAISPYCFQYAGLYSPAEEGFQIVLPDSLTTLCGYAFQYSGVTSVVIPGSVVRYPSALTGTSKGGSTFYKCEKLKTVVFEDGDQKLSLYPSYNMFYGCTALESAVLPNTFSSLKDPYSMFSGCTSLRTVTLSDTITEIGSSFFLNCTSLEHVDMPSVTIIGRSAFKGCTSLKSVVLNDKLTKIDSQAFQGSGLETVSLPDTLATLNSKAFADCASLRCVYISPSCGLKAIGTYAFGCNGLTSYKANSDGTRSLIYIGPQPTKEVNGKQVLLDVFLNDEGKLVDSDGNLLTDTDSEGNTVDRSALNLPKALTTIGEGVFASSGMWGTVVIPSTITKLDKYWFTDCRDLDTVKFEPNTNTAVLTPTVTYLFAGYTCNTLILPEGLKSLYKTANDYGYPFAYASIKKLVFPSTFNTLCTKSITSATSSYRLFNNCTDIEEVEFATDDNGACGLTWLQNYMFANMKIKTVTIPKTINTKNGSTWYHHWFYNCGELKEVKFADDSVIESFGKNGTSNTGHFDKCDKLETVKLPGKLKHVDYALIYRLPEFKSVSIPATVQTVHEFAFDNCPKLASITFERDENGNCALTTIEKQGFNGGDCTSIEIPKSVVTLGNFAFANHKNLTSVTFEGADDGSSKLETIGDVAFQYSAFATIDIPASVTYIGSHAFYGNGNLQRVVIPAGVDTIKLRSFSDCGSLTEVVFTPGEDGTYALRTIEDYAFCGSPITSIDLPAGLQEIGDSAFRATDLASVVIPATVTAIGPRAFYASGELTSVTFTANEDGSYSLTELGNYAFASSKKLTSEVVLPNSLETIGYNPFAYSPVAGISIAAGGEPKFVVDNGVVYDAEKTVLYFALQSVSGEFTLADTVKEVKQEAFGGSNITKFTSIGEGVVYGPYAFSASNLQEVSLGDKSVIDYYAFEDNASLSKVALGLGVTIDEGAFVNCTSLTSFSVPDGTVFTGLNVFKGCEALASFELGKNVKIDELGVALGSGANADTVILSGTDLAIADEAFAGELTLKKVIISEGVTSIGARAFKGASSLTSIVLPASLKSIGDNAFEGTALTSITLTGVTDIGNSAFEGLETLTSVTFADGLLTVGDRAFAGTGLTEIDLPSSVTTLGKEFIADTAITAFVIPAGVTEMNGLPSATLESVELAAGSALTTFPNSIFSGYTTLKRAVLPEGVTTIPKEMFKGTSLTSITIPASVTAIGDSAFQGCEQLTEVIFAKSEGVSSLLTIGKAAFEGTGLTTVSIPASVTTINDSAFQNTPIATLTFERCEGKLAITKIGNFCFASTKLTTVAIPETLTTLGGGSSASSPSAVFRDCVDLASVTFDLDAEGNGATCKILYGTFDNTALTEMILPDSVKGITGDAFKGTDLKKVRVGLGSLTFLSGVSKYVLGPSFKNTTTIEEIIVPEEFGGFNTGAFYGMTALKSFVVEGEPVPATKRIVIKEDYYFNGTEILKDLTPEQTIYFEAKGPGIDWSYYWHEGCKVNIVWGYTGE